MAKNSVPPRVAALVAALSLLLVACTSGGDDSPGAPSQQPATGQSESVSTADPAVAPTPGATLASAEGASPETMGAVIDVTSLRRISVETVTLVAIIRNAGPERLSYLALSSLRGDYRSPAASGVTLIDTAGKLRYYPLRDTNKRCVCTPFLLGESLPVGGETQVTVSFPAPPADVSSLVVDWIGFTPTDEVPLS